MEAIGLREVGGVGEESNVMNSDECTKEFQRVFDSIDVAEFGEKLLREPRQTAITSWRCTVNVRGIGNRVFLSFHRNGCTKEV